MPNQKISTPFSNALARAPATEKDTKTKGTHFSTGPTTSSRHSKKKQKN